VDWIHPTQGRDQWQALVNAVTKLWVTWKYLLYMYSTVPIIHVSLKALSNL
jgi:hypothetical protein